MTAQLTITTTFILMTLTAVGYAIATLGMKLAADKLTILAMALMAAGLICAALAEIALLRRADLSIVYLGIIAFESLLVLCFASMLGDRLSFQQLSGAALLMVGLALVAH